MDGRSPSRFCSRRWRRCSTQGRERAACRPSRRGPSSIRSPPASTRAGELSRYLIGLLIFLGLLGTFWGLLETVHSIGGVIDSMKTGGDTSRMFDDLKAGLSLPVAGMSISFTSSLFGLASSLVLGFLDLQAGQAQNRFYSEFEEFLASHVQTTPAIEPLPEGETATRAAHRAPAQRRRDRYARRGNPGAGRPHANRAAADPATGSRCRPSSRRISASSCVACSKS